MTLPFHARVQMTYHTFVASEDLQRTLVLDLCRNPLTLVGPQRHIVGEVRNLLRLGPEISLAGICGCGRRYASVRDGAYIPCGVTLLQWLSSPGNGESVCASTAMHRSICTFRNHLGSYAFNHVLYILNS